MPPLTHAERQKRYREKLKATNPEKLREQKKRNSERTSEQYKNKKAGFSEEQKEDLRKKWRENDKKKKNAPGISQNSATGKTKENTTDTKTIKQNQVARKHEKQIVTLKNQINVMMKGYISLNKRVQTQQKQIEDMNKKYENIMKKLGANTETGSPSMRTTM